MIFSVFKLENYKNIFPASLLPAAAAAIIIVIKFAFKVQDLPKKDI